MTSCKLTPACTAQLAHVCRKSCHRRGSKPAARTALVPDAGHVAFSDNFPGTVRAMCEFLEWTGQARDGHPAAAR